MKRLVYKYMDNLGNVMREFDSEVSIKIRNHYIREFTKGSQFLDKKVGDVLVIMIDSGEELWIYEEQSY